MRQCTLAFRLACIRRREKEQKQEGRPFRRGRERGRNVTFASTTAGTTRPCGREHQNKALDSISPLATAVSNEFTETHQPPPDGGRKLYPYRGKPEAVEEKPGPTGKRKAPLRSVPDALKRLLH